MRNKLRKLIKENFYIDHLDCSEECSKRWYAENSVEEAVEEIMQLFNEVIPEEIVERKKVTSLEYYEIGYNNAIKDIKKNLE